MGKYLYGFHSGITKYELWTTILFWVKVDQLTKMCRFIPTKTTVKMPKLARLFIDNIYKLYGLPSSIVSDRDIKILTINFGKQCSISLDTKLNLSTGRSSPNGWPNREG